MLWLDFVEKNCLADFGPPHVAATCLCLEGFFFHKPVSSQTKAKLCL